MVRSFDRKHSRFPSDRLLLFATVGCALSLAFGSGTVNAAAPAPKANPQRTILVLDHAENTLATSSLDHRQALKSVLETLPSDTPEFVRSDIETFLKRAPDERADFQCSHEFMRYRARQELERIKDKLLNTSQPAEPQFCYAVPFAIDLALPKKSLEIYGYDLDTKPLELFVVNKDATFEDVSFALSSRTHYHLSVDLGSNGVKFSPRSQTIIVAWGHLIRYSVSLIQPTTSLCSSEIEEIPAGKPITFPPQLISGSGRLGSRGSVRASTTLNYESNKLDATVCLMATDQEQNPTTLGGCGVEYVYTTDPARVIEGVFMKLESRISNIHPISGPNIIVEKSDGPVSRWTLDVPGAQSGASAEATVTVTLRKIRIASTRLDNCLPAVAYLEARRRSGLANTTLKRLDSESRKFQAEILKLRPRFAPRSD
jgi:hypothetical protein